MSRARLLTEETCQTRVWRPRSCPSPRDEDRTAISDGAVGVRAFLTSRLDVRGVEAGTLGAGLGSILAAILGAILSAGSGQLEEPAVSVHGAAFNRRARYSLVVWTVVVCSGEADAEWSGNVLAGLTLQVLACSLLDVPSRLVPQILVGLLLSVASRLFLKMLNRFLLRLVNGILLLLLRHDTLIAGLVRSLPTIHVVDQRAT